MWTLLLGYSFSVIFEESVYKLFKNKCHYRTRNLTYPEAGVGWLYQEHLKFKYDLTGAKKFISEHEYRYEILTQIILVWKFFCSHVHIVSTLEFGTFFLLFGVYSSIIIKFYLPKLKIVERISANNYLKLISLGIRRIKVELVKMRYLSFNDKIFFCVLFFLFKYVFKTYLWQDFFVLFRFLFIATFLFVVVFSIFLPNYLIYTYLIYNFSKNLALLTNLLAKKIFIFLLVSLVVIIPIVADIVIPTMDNENFFKEIFFKTLLFLAQIS